VRWYRVDGRLLPSVTSVLGLVLRKPGLERWRGRHGNEEADRQSAEARSSGSAVHRQVEVFNKNILLDPAFTGGEPPAYRAWFQANIAEPVLVETVTFSTLHGYAGRVDLVARMRSGRLAVIDIKTVGRFGCYPEYLLQTAAYAAALEESHGLAVGERHIVQIHRESGEVNLLTLEDLDGDFGAWLRVLEYFRWWCRRFPAELAREEFEIAEVRSG